MVRTVFLGITHSACGAGLPGMVQLKTVYAVSLAANIPLRLSAREDGFPPLAR